jgi:hypothetical protein
VRLVGNPTQESNARETGAFRRADHRRLSGETRSFLVERVEKPTDNKPSRCFVTVVNAIGGLGASGSWSPHAPSWKGSSSQFSGDPS